MALDSYDGLKAEVADWLNRQDLSVQIGTFIRLFESQFDRQMRVRQMVKRSTATLDSQYILLPTDYLSIHNVQLNTSPVQPLEFVTLHQLDKVRQETVSAGQPQFYSIMGDSIEVAPVPDTSYEIEIVYYSKLPKLSAENQTNWLLQESPDVYLYGALLQSAPYLHGDERIPVWASAVTSLFDNLRIEDERARYAGSPLTMRFTPY